MTYTYPHEVWRQPRTYCVNYIWHNLGTRWKYDVRRSCFCRYHKTHNANPKLKVWLQLWTGTRQSRSDGWIHGYTKTYLRHSFFTNTCQSYGTSNCNKSSNFQFTHTSIECNSCDIARALNTLTLGERDHTFELGERDIPRHFFRGCLSLTEFGLLVSGTQGSGTTEECKAPPHGIAHNVVWWVLACSCWRFIKRLPLRIPREDALMELNWKEPLGVLSNDCLYVFQGRTLFMELNWKEPLYETVFLLLPQPAIVTSYWNKSARTNSWHWRKSWCSWQKVKKSWW